ncbi:hypothetical protein FGG08_005049 [Glutinoglossum americanum]|uniref:Uncharacterized protein n=1 Tax=Glutinoglossum americanum TaxID=1670608 RepID=A0A9P8I136_9PEZI|nr:hypothetical protein FGG08_005049 [Glutinoglossum americanum]
MRKFFNFRNIVWDRKRNLRQENTLPTVPLSRLWHTVNHDVNFFIAHTLLRFHMLGDIYWGCLNRHYYGTEPEGRVNNFYETQAIECQLEIVKKKLDNLAIYEKELESLGIKNDQSEKPDPLRAIATGGIEAKGVVSYSKTLFTCLSLLSGR